MGLSESRLEASWADTVRTQGGSSCVFRIKTGSWEGSWKVPVPTLSSPLPFPLFLSLLFSEKLEKRNPMLLPCVASRNLNRFEELASSNTILRNYLAEYSIFCDG